MWVYERDPQEHLWTVGFYSPAGKWHTDSDHAVQEDAAKRVAFLNGHVSPLAHYTELLRQSEAEKKAVNGKGEIMGKESEKILNLTAAEIAQLRIYVEWTEDSGFYYGVKKHFEQRHAKIREVLGMTQEAKQ